MMMDSKFYNQSGLVESAVEEITGFHLKNNFDNAMCPMISALAFLPLILRMSSGMVDKK